MSGRKAGEELCDPLEMGPGKSKRPQEVVSYIVGDETGVLDLKVRMARLDLQLGCLVPTERGACSGWDHRMSRGKGGWKKGLALVDMGQKGRAVCSRCYVPELG